MSATPHIHEPFPALSRLPRGAQHTTRLGVLPTGMGQTSRPTSVRCERNGKQALEALTRHLCKDFCPKLRADIKTNLKKPGWSGGVWSVLKACSSLRQGEVRSHVVAHGAVGGQETSRSTATDFWMESGLHGRPACVSKRGCTRLTRPEPPTTTHSRPPRWGLAVCWSLAGLCIRGWGGRGGQDPPLGHRRHRHTKLPARGTGSHFPKEPRLAEGGLHPGLPCERPLDSGTRG